ncbi:MAG: RHS repeat-associated core domain-containing protein [Planctomycetes bacterium]|nr:RHS repeat-associated core domain-containing protein [Planctomycetota bacterium]
MFTGREWDAELGLYYYRARHYDPRTGRFLQVDPAAEGSNWYQYAANQPSGITDPTGRTIVVSCEQSESFRTKFQEQALVCAPRWLLAIFLSVSVAAGTANCQTDSAHGHGVQYWAKWATDDRPDVRWFAVRTLPAFGHN